MGKPVPWRITQLWMALPLIILSVLSIAALIWIWDHPYGVNWDEANYINRAYRDRFYVQSGGLGKFLNALVSEDVSRPPAFRMFAIPFTLVFGADPAIVRMVSLGSLWASFGFIFLAVRSLVGVAAGGFAIAWLAVCPILMAANMRFYVDYPLNLAIAAILYFLLRDWHQEKLRPSSWIGLGIALGIGALAKPPILFIAGPMLLLTLVLSWRKIIINPAPRYLIQSGAIALVMMLPWWVFNYRAAISKAFRSSTFAPHALGPKGSIVTMGKWFYVIGQTMLGPALTLLTLVIVGSFVVQWLRHRLDWDKKLQTALLVCLAGSVPLLLMAAISTNQNPRLISPALLPLAVAIAIMVALTQWMTQRSWAIAAAAVMAFQATVMLSPTPGEPRYQRGDRAAQHLLWGNPTSVFQRAEQWDWAPLRQIALDHNLGNPRIVYLGSDGPLSPPQVSLPWFQQNEKVNVDFLWRYEDEDIDWDAVMKKIDGKDIVFTVPEFTVPLSEDLEPYQRYEVLSNQYNRELIRRLKNDPRFQGPIEFSVGRFQPATVVVFIHR